MKLSAPIGIGFLVLLLACTSQLAAAQAASYYRFAMAAGRGQLRTGLYPYLKNQYTAQKSNEQSDRLKAAAAQERQLAQVS